MPETLDTPRKETPLTSRDIDAAMALEIAISKLQLGLEDQGRVLRDLGPILAMLMSKLNPLQFGSVKRRFAIDGGTEGIDHGSRVRVVGNGEEYVTIVNYDMNEGEKDESVVLSRDEGEDEDDKLDGGDPAFDEESTCCSPLISPLSLSTTITPLEDTASDTSTATTTNAASPSPPPASQLLALPIRSSRSPFARAELRSLNELGLYTISAVESHADHGTRSPGSVSNHVSGELDTDCHDDSFFTSGDAPQQTAHIDADDRSSISSECCGDRANSSSPHRALSEDEERFAHHQLHAIWHKIRDVKEKVDKHVKLVMRQQARLDDVLMQGGHNSSDASTFDSSQNDIVESICHITEARTRVDHARNAQTSNASPCCTVLEDDHNVERNDVHEQHKRLTDCTGQQLAAIAILHEEAAALNIEETCLKEVKRKNEMERNKMMSEIKDSLYRRDSMEAPIMRAGRNKVVMAQPSILTCCVVLTLLLTSWLIFALIVARRYKIVRLIY